MRTYGICCHEQLSTSHHSHCAHLTPHEPCLIPTPSDAKLYDDEIRELTATYPDQFRVDYALSREQQNVRGGKMYIQDKVEEYSDEIFSLLDNGAHIFFCGLKGMMPGILSMLERVAKDKGINFEVGQGRCVHDVNLKLNT